MTLDVNFLWKQNPNLKTFWLLETKLTTVVNKYFRILGYLKSILLLEKVRMYGKCTFKVS